MPGGMAGGVSLETSYHRCLVLIMLGPYLAFNKFLFKENLETGDKLSSEKAI